jgi:hypothetical protein
MITDEVVEKAQLAYYGTGYDHSGNENHLVQNTYSPSISMRAALEAVAPQLIAQGMREAAQLCIWAPMTERHILARAQELDPK